MKDNRDKWQFFEHPAKPALNGQETRYWKNTMSKLLKVGIEFEFNLPKQYGACKGGNIQCPCIHMEEGCWRNCTFINKCKSTPCYDTCAVKKSSCKPEDCESCNKYKFECLGIVCVDFVSSCFTCAKFERNCDTCSKRYDPDRDPNNIRQILMNELQPNRNYGKVSKSGVVEITKDGSLRGDKGVEVITIGRRVDFWEFYNMSKSIIDKATALGAYLNERTGSHMHILASYQDGISNEMEKDMPEIILANFHQLCRRYQNAMTWMTMALGDPNHMTRWEKFRVSVLGISPFRKTMNMVRSEIASHSGGSDGGKYGWVNYMRVYFNEQSGNIQRFHVEMRAADSTLSPTWYAAIACMYYALVIKAIDISRYGLLKVGDDDWAKKAHKMKEVILNNCGEYSDSNPRVSNTRHLLEYTDYFIEESLDLIKQLKGTLLKLGPAYDILLKIASRPASLRLIDGSTWNDIEKSLAVEIKDEDQIEIAMDEVVELRIIEDCKSTEEWINEVHRMFNKEEKDLSITKEHIRTYIESKLREGEIIWSESVGSMVII